jgi:hypothetical protein
MSALVRADWDRAPFDFRKCPKADTLFSAPAFNASASGSVVASNAATKQSIEQRGSVDCFAEPVIARIRATQRRAMTGGIEHTCALSRRDASAQRALTPRQQNPIVTLN